MVVLEDPITGDFPSRTTLEEDEGLAEPHIARYFADLAIEVPSGCAMHAWEMELQIARPVAVQFNVFAHAAYFLHLFYSHAVGIGGSIGRGETGADGVWLYRGGHGWCALALEEEREGIASDRLACPPTSLPTGGRDLASGCHRGTEPLSRRRGAAWMAAWGLYLSDPMCHKGSVSIRNSTCLIFMRAIPCAAAWESDRPAQPSHRT